MSIFFLHSKQSLLFWILLIQEEKAELKAQYYLLEKEKKALELKLTSREAQEKAYLVQIDHLKSEVREQQWADMNGTKGKDLSKFSKVGYYPKTLDINWLPSYIVRSQYKLD